VARGPPPEPGAQLGERPGVFAKVGDSITVSDAFLADLACAPDEDFPHLFVSNRTGFDAAWHAVAVARPGGPRFLWDDKPAIAVDTWPSSPHTERVYVAWSRITEDAGAIFLAHSDNGGITWSTPAPVGAGRSFDSYPNIAVASDGGVYVAWWNATGRGISIALSRDGGDSFAAGHRIDPIRGKNYCPNRAPGIRIPAQPTNCVRPNPVVSVDNSAGPFHGRVYVTYGDTGGKRREQDVFVAAYDPSLNVIFRRRRIGPADGRRRSDQFWPASAVDASTGYLWACYYDTRGDRRRKRAWFTCTRSTDGGVHWARPVHAASVPSNETQRGADTGHHGFGREYGDYEGLAVANGVAHPIWTDSRRMRTLQEEVFTTTLSDASFR
jgi:hypothetical protein